MKRFLYIAFAMMVIVLLAAGCGQTDSETSGSGAEGESAQSKSGEEKEELTAMDVITKSSEAMLDWPGMDFTSTTKQNVTVQQGENQQVVEQQMDMDSKMTMDPITMQMSGQMNMQGQQMPMENYYVDNVMYTKGPNGQWIGVEGMNLDQLTKQSQGKNPAEQMKQFAEMMKELSSSDGGKELISMKEENDMFVVEINLNEEASTKVMDMAMEQIKSSMGQQMQQLGVGNALEQMKVKSMAQTYYINKETFEQSKMEQQMVIEMPFQGMNMSIGMDTTTEINGKVEEPITVPEDVKNNAQVISLEQLQKAQQQMQQQQNQGQGQNQQGQKNNQ
ncbi:DUF6612 family protein [Virgibacillus doumboii]|uniref:DUF6612 family protein n=1 Tax=Virgibacillus doumboii TaxID=2697503 RepID=UPI0013E01A28|nr:DUF6612 family protein [Virgibacillus doumboii]